jgi:hypothetical protein
MIQITNCAAQNCCFVAFHQEVCVRQGRCTCDPRTRQPRAYHLTVGATARVPAALLYSVDLQVALQAGCVRVVRIPSLTDRPPAAPPVPPRSGSTKAKKAGPRSPQED